MAENHIKLQSQLLFNVALTAPAPIKKLQRDTTKVLVSFLKTAELRQLIVADKQRHIDSQAFLNDRKKVIVLLEIVFNEPSCKTVQEWLKENKPAAPIPFPLVPSNVEETFFSKSKKAKMSKRKRQDFTPLKAAAISGDNFLVRTLIEFIPDHLKYEAGMLLFIIRNSEEYLEDFKMLIEAYNEFIEQHPKLSPHTSNVPDPWKVKPKLYMLERKIGDCQFYLPTYGIQEYCDDTPFDPVPKFDKEPKRSCLYDNNSNNSTIDIHGLCSSWIIYKGDCKGSKFRYSSYWWSYSIAVADLAAIRRLCEVRSFELDCIIQMLLKYKPKSKENETEIEMNNVNSRKVRV